MLAYGRLELVAAVVIAGDGAGPDIGARADMGVTEVGQMVGFGAFAELRLLELHEIAHVGVGTEIGTGAQAGIRTDQRSARNMGALEVAEGMNNRAALDFRITDDADPLDARAGMENGTPGDFTGAGDLDAWLNAHERTDAHGLGIMQNNAALHKALHNARAHNLFSARKLCRGVDAEQALIAAAHDTLHAVSFLKSQGHEIGDVVLAALVLVGHLGEEALGQGAAEVVEAGVHLACGGAVLRLVVILGFHDGLDMPVHADNPAVGAGIIKADGGEGEIAVAGF